MFPANEMIMAAEVEYRRERLMAVKPRRSRRRSERRRASTAETTTRAVPRVSQGAAGA